MKLKIKDITGMEITVTHIRKAIKQCRNCIGSPYKMPSGHTIGENHAYMLKQLLDQQKHQAHG